MRATSAAEQVLSRGPRFPDYCMLFIMHLSYLSMLSTLSMLEEYVRLDISLMMSASGLMQTRSMFQ